MACVFPRGGSLLVGFVLCYAAGALPGHSIAETAVLDGSDDRVVISGIQKARLNFAVIWERDDTLTFIDLDQDGVQNYASLRQQYGDQFASIFQNGLRNYSRQVQLDGDVNFSVVVQGGPTQSPSHVAGTIFTRETYDDSYLVNFVSGDVDILIYAPEGTMSTIGRKH